MNSKKNVLYLQSVPFNKLSHSILGEIRPRFRLKTSLNLEEVKKLLDETIKEDSTLTGAVKMDYAILKIPLKDRHYWSPELQVHLEKMEDSEETLLRCLVGPSQTVWASFLMIYIVIGILTLFFGMFGMIRWQLGEFSNIVFAVPVGLILLPTIYIFSKAGQRTGHEQMMHLVSFLYHQLDQKGEVARVA